MSRGTKLFIGLLSFLPIIGLIILFSFIFNLLPEIIEWSNYEPDPYTVFETMRPLFIIGLCMGLLSLGLLVFFIMHLVRNKKMDSTERVIWILVFLFVSIVGYPIYWYMRVWRDDL